MKSTIRRTLALAAAGAAITAAASACTPTPAKPAPVVGLGTTRLSAPLPGPITVQDDTAGTIPLRAAVAKWGVPVRYGVCTVTAGWCIHAELTAMPGPLDPPPAELGRSSQFPPMRLTILTFSPVIPAGETAQVACHEVGHALGLDHDTTGGCMYANTSGAYPNPSGADLAAIRQMYPPR